MDADILDELVAINAQLLATSDALVESLVITNAWLYTLAVVVTLRFGLDTWGIVHRALSCKRWL